MRSRPVESLCGPTNQNIQSIGSESLAEACNAIGGIKKVVVLSPCYPVANREVIRFLADLGIADRLDGFGQLLAGH